MENFWTKTGIAAAVSFLSIKSGLKTEFLIIWIIAMVLDYVSGVIAGAILGELDSKKGILGIVKKLGYILILCVAVLVDLLLANCGEQLGLNLGISCTFSILVIVWLTLNELLSITENISKMGIPLPSFLQKAIKSIQDQTENDDKNN